MAKKLDEDDEFETVRPGDISDLFEDDDSFEINEIEENNLVNLNDPSEEDKEGWDKYLVNDEEDKNAKVFDNGSEGDNNDVSSEQVEQADAAEIAKIQEELRIFDENMAKNAKKESSTEEKTVEMDEKDVINQMLAEAESPSDDSDEESDTTYTGDFNLDEAVKIDDDDKDEAGEVIEVKTREVEETPVTEEPEQPVNDTKETESDKESEKEPEKESDTPTKTEESKRIEVVETDNKDLESEKSDRFRDNDEKKKPTFNPDDIVSDIDEFNTTNLNAAFKYRVEKIYESYPNESIEKWLNEAKAANKLQLLKDFYIREYSIYHNDIDFTHPMAQHDLWTVVAYDYYKFTVDELYKKEGTYVESVTPDAFLKDGVIVEDENIRLQKEQKRMNEEKYAKYKLDRTIFDIADEEDMENTSIFDDKKNMMDEFFESPFYKILKEVMTSTDVVNMKNVRCKVLINAQTSMIPVIDFNTGIRCICIDTDDVDQYNMNITTISRRLKFSFKLINTPMRTRVLYSDSCKMCPVAVISSLRKLVGYKFYKERYKINLKHNYAIAYTTERKYIDMFEKGDLDSKQYGSSTYCAPKASNMAVGLIVVEKKKNRDRSAIRRNQYRRDSDPNYKIDAGDYNAFFVASARIIRNDLRLRDPTYPKNERYVEYIIVQYNEHNKVIINDGFAAICSCIIREHMKNYDIGTNYSISYEFDRDNLVSPSVIGMLDDRDGVEPSISRGNPSPFATTAQFILPPSRRSMDGVYEFEKTRLEPKFFSVTGIQKCYQERSLWQNYDISTPRGRADFIKSRGFEEFTTPAPITFDVLPYTLNILEAGEMTYNLTKVSISMLRDRTSEDTNNLLFKQRELEYIKSIGGASNYGGFHKFLCSVLDYILDTHKEQ
jgi:hypothetical protein